VVLEEAWGVVGPTVYKEEAEARWWEGYGVGDERHKLLATLYALKETSTRSYTARYCRTMSSVVTMIFILIIMTTISSRTTIQSTQRRLFKPGFSKTTWISCHGRQIAQILA